MQSVILWLWEEPVPICLFLRADPHQAAISGGILQLKWVRSGKFASSRNQEDISVQGWECQELPSQHDGPIQAELP